jgi:hypothetical protein
MADEKKTPQPPAAPPKKDLKAAFLGSGAQKKPVAEVPKVGQRRPVEDEDLARTQIKKENSARLDFTLEYGRPAIFVREKPGEPGAQQFMVLEAGTVKADGSWDGWAVHPDTGATRINNKNNTQGKWQFAGYMQIVDAQGSPVPLKKTGAK